MKKGEIMTDKDIFIKTAIAYGLDKEPFELRFLNGFKYGVHYGYFDNLDKAYEAIKPYWRRYTCYFTLQEINPSITARSHNLLQETKKVTTDSDILHYRFLHIDIDPVRPSGIQANIEEVKYARDKAKEVNKFLREVMRFPKPVVVFSGNGMTLDYRLQRIVANAENRELVKNSLQVLSVLFSDDKANIDTSVHNPSRIIKLAGTISAKGSSTEDRPHRYSELKLAPEDNNVVSKKQLKKLASMKEELIDEKR